ncbi:hypothetical protein TNCV_3523561 [Trichonephila clavipes]|nr:hypothetical protein TNCV_3523561 [Trichonephila clavipes]
MEIWLEGTSQEKSNGTSNFMTESSSVGNVKKRMRPSGLMTVPVQLQLEQMKYVGCVTTAAMVSSDKSLMDVNAMVQQLPSQLEDDHSSNVNKKNMIHKSTYRSGVVKKSEKCTGGFACKAAHYPLEGRTLSWYCFCPVFNTCCGVVVRRLGASSGVVHVT